MPTGVRVLFFRCQEVVMMERKHKIRVAAAIAAIAVC